MVCLIGRGLDWGWTGGGGDNSGLIINHQFAIVSRMEGLTSTLHIISEYQTCLETNNSHIPNTFVKLLLKMFDITSEALRLTINGKKHISGRGLTLLLNMFFQT